MQNTGLKSQNIPQNSKEETSKQLETAGDQVYKMQGLKESKHSQNRHGHIQAT